jgi:ligand-binding sensor domain-containing protein/signal transduction histidine kinase
MSRFRRHLLLVLLCLLAAASSRAAESSPAQYTRRIWHIQNGLPEETVQALQQTTDGYLWVGTTGGLSRFDGSRFVTWSRNTVPGLPENSVFCILIARDGTLWLGTEGGGLVHDVHGKFQVYSARQGLTDNFVRSVIQDDRGRLWIGTDNGLFRMADGVVHHVDTSRVAPGLAVHAIVEDREHRIWVGGSRLLRFEGDQVREFKLPGAYSQNRVKSILQTRDGTIWVGTVSGLQRLVGNHFVPVPGIAATVRTLRQTTDGTLWIGTIGHGLYTWSHGQLRKMSVHGLLPSNTVLDIFEDATDQIWLGTQDGLVRLSKTPVRVIPLPGGSDPDFETISHDSDGTIWAVSSQVYAIRNDHAEPYVFSSLPKVSVRNVFRDREGTLWIGTDGSGAYHITPHGVVHYAAPLGLVNNFVRVFLQSRDGSMWIATDEGLSHIVNGHTHNYHVSDGLAYFSTRALMEDRQGNLWIGTDQGLSCWNGKRFVQNVATRALSDEKIWSILQDGNGVIWFGTRDHGLFRYRHDKLTQFTTTQGLASNSIYQLLADHHGQLWMSSPNTISSMPMAALDNDAQAPGLHFAVTIYNMPYDADGAQLYGGRQPSGCLGSDGGVWFPSNKGAVHILYEPVSRASAPKLLLTNVDVDGSEMTPAAFHVLSADTARVEISYAPLSLQSQDDIRFRYRLVPFDRKWIYAGTNRVAAYTNLPAGHYRFEVIAFPLDNPSSISEATLAFRKLPHFYATWWFLSLCVLFLCMASLGAYRWRVRSLRLRFKAVLDERSRLAREMHDTVIQGCTSISALLEAISSLDSENDSLHEELLDYARTQVRTTIDEARQAVWNLRHGDEPQQDLSAAAHLLAEHTGKEFGLAIECRSQGTRFLVPSSIAHEVLMVIREGVYNAVLHGKPARVWIEFCYGDDDLEIKVRDNGSGFEPGTTPTDGKPHYGIAGMRERVERLHGKIEWMSQRGEGTTVRLRLRRSALFPAKEKVTL